jgi:hypothetical protein
MLQQVSSDKEKKGLVLSSPFVTWSAVDRPHALTEIMLGKAPRGFAFLLDAKTSLIAETNRLELYE